MHSFFVVLEFENIDFVFCADEFTGYTNQDYFLKRSPIACIRCIRYMFLLFDFLRFNWAKLIQEGEQITKRRFSNLIRFIFIIYYLEQLIEYA